MNGEWLGQYGAYTPWEGKPEPVWLDDKNKWVSRQHAQRDMQQCKI
jgi:hypothetical protein